MAAQRSRRLETVILLLAALSAMIPAVALGQAATPAGPVATPVAAARAVVWERIDVTVELRDDGTLHITERMQVAFQGGPFRTGFRDIPLARIESLDTILVGEVSGTTVQPFRFVRQDEFSRDISNTYTFAPVSSAMRISWSFPPATSVARTFEMSYDALGALRIYDKAAPPFQEISWIGVGEELAAAAPVNVATLTFILPRPVDLDETAVAGPGGSLPRQHTMDGKTWVWTARDLGAGESLEATLRFPPLVAATAPSWQEESGRAAQDQAAAATRGTPAPLATPLPTISSCAERIRDIPAPVTWELMGDCVTDARLDLPDGWTFDGRGHTIFAVDPPDGVLASGVVTLTGVSGLVRDVTIDGSGLTAPCAVDRGLTALFGVMLLDATGKISHVTVRNLQRSLPATIPDQPGESERESCGAGVGIFATQEAAGALVTVSGATIENVGYAGIVIEGARATVSHSIVRSVLDTGILALGGANAAVGPGNRVTDGHVGIQVEGNDTYGNVRDNMIEQMTRMGIAVIANAAGSVETNFVTNAANGIALESASGVVAIDGNTVERPDKIGIKVLASRAEVIGNTVRLDDPASYGITAASLPSFTARGNTISGRGMVGIYAHRAETTRITNNTIAGMDLGIGLGGSSVGAVAGNTITGSASTDSVGIGVAGLADASVRTNTVRSSGHGIQVEDEGSRATIVGNRVSQCLHSGIIATRGGEATIEANQVSGCGDSGVRITLGASGTAIENEIAGCPVGIVVIYAGSRGELRQDAVTGLLVDGVPRQVGVAGISVAQGPSATITANQVEANITGIDARHPGSVATIDRNYVRNPSQFGIVVRDGAHAAVIDNEITGAGLHGISIEGGSSASPLRGNEISLGRDAEDALGCAIRIAGSAPHDALEVNRFPEPRNARDLCLEPGDATPAAMPHAMPLPGASDGG